MPSLESDNISRNAHLSSISQSTICKLYYCIVGNCLTPRRIYNIFFVFSITHLKQFFVKIVYLVNDLSANVCSLFLKQTGSILRPIYVQIFIQYKDIELLRETIRHYCFKQEILFLMNESIIKSLLKRNIREMFIQLNFIAFCSHISIY